VREGAFCSCAPFCSSVSRNSNARSRLPLTDRSVMSREIGDCQRARMPSLASFISFLYLQNRRGTQVARGRSARPLMVGSIPARAFIQMQRSLRNRDQLSDDCVAGRVNLRQPSECPFPKPPPPRRPGNAVAPKYLVTRGESWRPKELGLVVLESTLIRGKGAGLTRLKISCVRNLGPRFASPEGYKMEDTAASTT
jgi:hypothetical protein